MKEEMFKALQLLKTAFPCFSWEPTETGLKSQYWPRGINDQEMPLEVAIEAANKKLAGEYVLTATPQSLEEAILYEAGLMEMSRLSPLGKRFASFLLEHDLDCKFQRKFKGNALVKWFEALEREGCGQIITVVCPDYPWEDRDGKYAYLFGGLGTGIGLTALKFLPLVSKIDRFFAQEGIEIEFGIYIGDHEADKKANLISAGDITKEEFIRRCKCSAQSMDQYLEKEGVRKYAVGLLTQINRELWDSCLVEVTQLAQKRMFGPGMNMNLFKRILGGRIKLYKSWYGSDANFEETLISQAIEYMAIGLYRSKVFTNPLGISADNPQMHFFSHVGSEAGWPVLNRPRFYD